MTRDEIISQAKMEGGMMMVIPSVVILDSDLPMSARMLYGVITWKCNQEAYTHATNKKLGEALGVSAKRVSELLSLLESHGHIETEIEYKEGSKEILRRYVFPIMKSSREKVMAKNCADPIPKKTDTPPPDCECPSRSSGRPLPKNAEVICKSKEEHKGNIFPPTPQGGSAPPEKTTPKGKRPKTVPQYRPDWFERFWALYPRKTNRVAAVRAWDKLSPDLDLCRVMAIAIRAQMKTPQWQEGPDHIPHPSTWLNGARWLDEVVITPPGDSSSGWAPDPEVY